MGKTVVVGMSGGVDSTFAAAYLKNEGYEVIGVMLRLWAETGMEEQNKCCSPDAMTMARRVAAMLDVPFYVIDAKEAFRAKVVEYFIQGYTRGITPNPCLVCNTDIRWRTLLEQADKFGADMVATGHYAQIDHSNPAPKLLRGRDTRKDQSYVLSRLPLEYLKRTILPVAGFTKPEVMAYCQDLHLPTAARPDSQDLCFLGEMNYRDFLAKYSPSSLQPGDIVDSNGKVLGKHQGLGAYTLGQRKGLRIAYKEPLYVIDKDAENNRLMVGTKDETKKQTIHVSLFNWLEKPEVEGFDALVQVRYNSRPQPAKIFAKLNEAEIEFEQPVADIASGQVAAIYVGNVCWGGGIIV